MTTMPVVSPSVGAVDMIREDHRRIKALFREFLDSDDDRLRAEVAASAIEELELHTAAEEDHFYPALRKAVDVDAVLEAREAHHAAKVLITELKLLPAGRRFNAKFKVLIDAVVAHIREEEMVLLPAAESSRLDLQEIARRMTLDKYRQLGRLEAAKVVGGTGLVALLTGATLAIGAWLLLSRSAD